MEVNRYIGDMFEKLIVKDNITDKAMCILKTIHPNAKIIKESDKMKEDINVKQVKILSEIYNELKNKYDETDMIMNLCVITSFKDNVDKLSEVSVWDDEKENFKLLLDNIKNLALQAYRGDINIIDGSELVDMAKRRIVEYVGDKKSLIKIVMDSDPAFINHLSLKTLYELNDFTKEFFDKLMENEICDVMEINIGYFDMFDEEVINKIAKL